jgi:hypothetical protein
MPSSIRSVRSIPHASCSLRFQLHMDPVLQLPGVNQDSLDGLTKELRITRKDKNLLWRLRQLPRDKVAGILHKKLKGKVGSPIRSTLDSLYLLPKVTVREALVSHVVDKTNGKSRGTLKIVIEIDRDTNKSKNSARNGGFSLLAVLLGSFERRLLLAQTEMSVSHGGSRSVTKEIDFDWDSANADGGEGEGFIILRLLLDNVCGMDSEVLIRLR